VPRRGGPGLGLAGLAALRRSGSTASVNESFSVWETFDHRVGRLSALVVTSLALLLALHSGGWSLWLGFTLVMVAAAFPVEKVQSFLAQPLIRLDRHKPGVITIAIIVWLWALAAVLLHVSRALSQIVYYTASLLRELSADVGSLTQVLTEPDVYTFWFTRLVGPIAADVNLPLLLGFAPFVAVLMSLVDEGSFRPGSLLQ
jgi:hypothetical protein